MRGLNEGALHGHGNYDWDQELQGIILGAFYIGYIISHVPGGILADILGGKWILGLGLLSTAIFTLITPYFIVHSGPYALIGLRGLMGLGEGTTFPALSTLLSRWVPIKERGKLGSIVLSGGILGQILGQTIAGLILNYYEWEIVFYFFGISGVVWFLFFIILCWSDPFSHPYIKQSEKDFLMTEMGSIKQEKHQAIPWKKIFKSGSVWALAIAQMGHDWGFYIMAIDLPKYMNDVLQFNVKSNGFYSSLPFVFMWFTSIGSGFLGDAMIKHGWLNITNVRKFMTGLAAFVPAFFLVAAAYSGCDKIVVVAMFTAAMFFMGPYYCGIKLTPLDLSRKFSGILMSISNGMGSITGFVSPWLVGVMTPDTSMAEWRLVFWLAFAVLCITAVFFLIWGSGEVQDFDNEEEKK